MFINEEELIPVIVHYRKSGHQFIAYPDVRFTQEKMSEELRKKFKKLTVQMKPLTWGMYNNLQDSATIDTEEGKRRFVYKIYKENRLKTLIMKWDATNVNAAGEIVAVPPTEDNILKLSPDIAEAILESYENASLMTNEDEKK